MPQAPFQKIYADFFKWTSEQKPTWATFGLRRSNWMELHGFFVSKWPFSVSGSFVAAWAPSQYKDRLLRYGIGNPMLKTRRSQDRLIFNPEIHQPVRHLYIATGSIGICIDENTSIIAYITSLDPSDLANFTHPRYTCTQNNTLLE